MRSGHGANLFQRASESNPQRRRASTWVMVALSVLGLVAVVALGTGLYLTSRTKQTTVPPLVGMTQEAATHALQNANLMFGLPETMGLMHVPILP